MNSRLNNILTTTLGVHDGEMKPVDAQNKAIIFGCFTRFDLLPLATSSCIQRSSILESTDAKNYPAMFFVTYRRPWRTTEAI